MDEDLPTEFDLVVIGTGFPESCVAAAASRVGKAVLHIDPNEYYGGSWASFGLDAFSRLMSQDEQSIKCEIRNARNEWHVPESIAENAENQEAASTEWSKETLLKCARKFNIDICPKLLYSCGSLVQLLISSNICRYAEFRAVDRIITLFYGKLLSVPCTRSDVFNTKDLNIVEKRLLMKLLTTCMAYGEQKCDEDSFEYRGKTFMEFLSQQRLTDKIQKCVTQAIAMANEHTPFEEGMQRTKTFLKSLGRYGNTPFIFPMYGCGEVPQCFCRLCAVFGGIYCLKRKISAINVDEATQTATVEIDGNQQIKAKHIVCSNSNLPAHMRSDSPKNYLSRAVFLASTPLGSEDMNSGGGGVNVMRLTTSDGEREAILLQLSHYSGTCPKGVYIFHLTTPALSDNPSQDLEPFVQQIFSPSEESPKLLYSAYFSIGGFELGPIPSPLVQATAEPVYELDYDSSIQNAQSIFSKMYADEEFLPRAPDPEQIVVEGEDPLELNAQYLPEDLREIYELEKKAKQMAVDDAAADEHIPSPDAMEH